MGGEESSSERGWEEGVGREGGGKREGVDR